LSCLKLILAAGIQEIVCGQPAGTSESGSCAQNLLLLGGSARLRYLLSEEESSAGDIFAKGDVRGA